MKISCQAGLMFFAVTLVALMPSRYNRALAQGCVAAHSEQPIIAGLDATSQPRSSNLLHGLSVTIGFRTYNSYKHYIGTVYQVQRAEMHNQVQNHVDLYDLGLSYQLTPRWSIIADIPGMTATRHQQGNVNVYRSGGIGDMLVGAQAWVWRPPTESHGNIAFSAQLKLPTGINDAKGTTILSNGQKQVRPFDESIQPGDGTWGFALATEAYREFYFRTTGYFTGSWLFSPQDTTGVKTYRSAPGEDVISATDQYLWRGGFSHPVPKLYGLALSIGGRMEGVPVRDAFGSSNGFRRPGYVISMEPGLMYVRGRNMVNVSGPWAMERNRKTSVTDYANHTHGDAAFSDYTVIASYTRNF
ncbi:hypothetical protein [Alloacidobacterium sp.]|uniref:hypothetical protein n=1 Tax=Alloacidobacterium sp. TaxID=2951999 RepID=UPI002D264D2B|nr:hypothetical protein [Alloacidobacterium sp.]HYK38201.1 hypothetical protein [Alloacidobacterium sp.]